MAGVGGVLHELVKIRSAQLSASMQRVVASRLTVVSFPWMTSYHMSGVSCRAQFQEGSNLRALKVSKAGRTPST